MRSASGTQAVPPILPFLAGSRSLLCWAAWPVPNINVKDAIFDFPELDINFREPEHLFLKQLCKLDFFLMRHFFFSPRYSSRSVLSRASISASLMFSNFIAPPLGVYPLEFEI